VHIAETDEQASREMDILLDQYQASIDQESINNKRAERISGVSLPSQPHARTHGWKDTWCLYGSPDTVISTLKEYERLGIGNILGGFQGGPLTAQRREFTQQTMDLFSSRVMPQFS
jgi:alkanesulfonate monooxygenase SsuD/methylene tetrahydromethanopterin reductase-like flavin-dependent oxidoreductase (luciferase family)